MKRLPFGVASARRAALCAWVASQGCLLVDYDEHPLVADSADAALPDVGVDGMDATTPADAADAPAMDARTEDVLVEAARDASSVEAAAPRDAKPSADANRTDASTDATACPFMNTCGGCTTLAYAVNAPCGACGVGKYACDGKDAVACVGGSATPQASGGTLLIDDLEDGDKYVRSDAGLSGAWFTVSDGSTAGVLNPPVGTAPTPTAGGAHGSAYAMHVSGSGFTKWGAGIAVSLNAYGCAYDAASESGLSAYVKGTGTLLISVATRATVPTASGGDCTGNCNDHFNVTTALTSTWTSKKVPFSTLKQTGWGTPATFKASDILYLQFSFGPNVSFDVSVDDVSFY